MIEIVANLHMHTPYSDGEWYHDDIAKAAHRAELDVICVTDHNVHVRGPEGWYGNVLMLIGEEVHDCLRRPQVSHLLVYGTGQDMSPLAQNTQKLVDGVKAAGGLSFPAHPFEFASPLDSDLDAYPWQDWNVRGLNGLELWNYMTEWKSHLRWPLAPLVLFFPSLLISGPFAQTLQKWDEILAHGERFPVIGNADAHGIVVRRGPLSTRVFDYEYLFRCVNTHLLIEKPLTRNYEYDRKLVLDALRAGRSFVGYDLGARTRGFSFTARSGADRFNIGDEFKRRSTVDFEIKTPSFAHIRLIRNGETVASNMGKHMQFRSTEPGAYRVEAKRLFRGWLRGWIYSSPIYVR